MSLRQVFGLGAPSYAVYVKLIIKYPTDSFLIKIYRA